MIDLHPCRDLGSGKSVVARGMLEALLKKNSEEEREDCNETTTIASPTFLKCIPYHIESKEHGR